MALQYLEGTDPDEGKRPSDIIFSPIFNIKYHIKLFIFLVEL